MPQINLLTWREQAKQAKKTRFTAIATAFVILAFICILILHFYYDRLLTVALDRNTYLVSQLGIEQGQLTELIARKKELTTVDTELHFIMGLRERSYQAVQLLDALSRTVPESITLNKITRLGSIITIEAKANADANISMFMDKLKTLKMFNQPNLTIISEKDDTSTSGILFQLKIEQRE